MNLTPERNSSAQSEPRLPIELQHYILQLAFLSPPLSASSETIAARSSDLQACCYVNHAWKSICQDLLLEDVAVFDITQLPAIYSILEHERHGISNGARVKVLRVGDTRKEGKEAWTGDLWHGLLDLVPTVGNLFVHGLQISKRGDNVHLVGTNGLDELVRPCEFTQLNLFLVITLLTCLLNQAIQSLYVSGISLGRRRRPGTSSPTLKHLNLSDCQAFVARMLLPNQSPHEEIYRTFPELQSLFIHYGRYTGRRQRANAHNLSVLSAFASDDPAGGWPSTPPLKILQIQCPPLGPDGTYAHLPPFATTLEIIRITCLPVTHDSSEASRFIQHLIIMLPTLPHLRYLYLPQVYSLSSISGLCRLCESQKVNCIFAPGLEKGVAGYDDLNEIFWKDVQLLEGGRMVM